jgi:hypothetical protein
MAFDSSSQVFRMPRTVTIISHDKSSIFSIKSLWTNESRSTERCYNTPERMKDRKTKIVKGKKRQELGMFS